MLSFEQVSFSYGNKQILHDISFTVPAGKIVALLGESGAGKSTLANLACGLRQPSRGRINHPNKLGATQMIFQSSSQSLSPHLSVFELVAEGLLIQGRKRADIAEAVYSCLRSVGLDVSFSGRYMADLSGGQRQRVNIARAIIMRPQLIIADEPVSALDVSVQAQICNLLKPLVQVEQCGMLLVIHDLSLAEYLADEIVVLKQGQIVEQGNVGSVYRQPKHSYTRALLRANGYGDV